MKRRTPSGIKHPAAAPQRDYVYPFSAIVGQEQMKLALLLSAIDPTIGGVLIMGHRGTGKSTAVRGLADLLPKLSKVRDCRYGCDPAGLSHVCIECRRRIGAGEKLRHERASVPVITLPLGATEDRVCGTIDIERALARGIKVFEPGLLARANRGFLYIDEVNLLEDHLVDLLLDVSGTGRNVVEREGISIEHPARFVLVGTGNPEEGELRPQLVDRFGLSVDITTDSDVEHRVQIVQRRDEFELRPAEFRAAFEVEQKRLQRRIMRACRLFREVELPGELLRVIAAICLRLNVDGHRGELTMARAARALAAFEGRRSISGDDIRRVAAMSLRHRLRRDPFDETSGASGIERTLQELLGATIDHPPGGELEPKARFSRFDSPRVDTPEDNNDGDGQTMRDEAKVEGTGYSARRSLGYSSHGGLDGPDKRLDKEMADSNLPEESIHHREVRRRQSAPGTSRKTAGRAAGRRSASRFSRSSGRGRYVRAVAARPIHPRQPRIAIDATLRAAAFQFRHPESSPASCTAVKVFAVGPEAIRFKKLSHKVGSLFIFAIDASGSMARDRISQAKRALVSLLRQSYIRRDLVALIAFRNRGAEVLLAPSRSTTRARRVLESLPVGGATPLSAGILCSLEIARKAMREGTSQISLLVFTDGGANVPLCSVPGLGRRARGRLIEQELEWLGEALHELGCVPLIFETRDRFTSNGEVGALAKTLRGYTQEAGSAGL